MYWRVAFLLVVAVFLAGTHWKTYTMGKQTVQAAWDKQVAEAEKQAREKELKLVAEKQKAEEAYVQEKQKAARAAAGARTELDRLRAELASRGEASPNPAAGPRVDGRAGLEQELLGQCASALVSMAAEADRLEAWIIGLQGYVKGVCLAR